MADLSLYVVAAVAETSPCQPATVAPQIAARLADCSGVVGHAPTDAPQLGGRAGAQGRSPAKLYQK